MSFMSPQIWQEDFYSLETDCGSEIVPVSVCGKIAIHELNQMTETVFTVETETQRQGALEHFRDFIEGEEIFSFHLVEGKYLFRLSASGYMDCTDTSFADSEEEAIEEILESYGNPDCPEDWEEELTERLSELRGESEGNKSCLLSPLSSPVILRDALHNLHPSENGEDHSFGRGLLVGVVSVFMSQGMLFDEACKLTLSHCGEIHPERVPPSWKKNFNLPE